MKCRKARKLIDNLLDNALSDSSRAWLETHLRECRSCEKYAAQMQESLDLIHDLPLVEPSENFNWTVRLKLARERHSLQEQLVSHDGWVRTWTVRFVLGSVAAFALVFAGGYLFLESHGPDSYRFASRGKPASPALQTPDRSLVAGGSTVSRETPGSLIPGRFGERFVSQGLPVQRSDYQSYQAIDEEGAQNITDPDSLVASKLRDMRAKYRMHYLERQIDLLQEYLRQCQLEQH
jgi:hypothetical protein